MAGVADRPARRGLEGRNLVGYFGPQLWEVMEYRHDEGNGLRIGLDDYPIFDEAYRPILNQLIIDEYVNREIGQETAELFIHRLRLKMRQIMPYFNQLYKSELVQFNPLATFDLNTVRSDTAGGNAKSNANGTTGVTSGSKARTVNSDTPENQLSDAEDYADSLTDSTSEGTSATTSGQATTSENSSTASGNSHVTGFQGAAADLLQKYRATFLNIDMMIIPQLNELFSLVLSTGTEILPSPHEYGRLPQIESWY
jgi:hypothetical protein